MKNTLATIMTAITVGLTSCSTKPAEADLVVLYTTDVHGACLAFDFKKNMPSATSLANVSTYVNEVREENPGAVLLFDTGDFLQGQPSVYYSNFVDTTDTHLCARTYNYLKYDAIGVGNHDIEPGEDVYGRRLPSQLQMPWLCANAIDQRTGKPMFQPYAVYERQGLKIAVLGMITPHIHAWLPKALWPNLEFQDMVECAEQWVPFIRQKEKPDLLIGLFHSGGDYTVNNSDLDTYCNENGAVPAAIKVPGIDFCLLGHDHQIREFEVVNVKGDTVKMLDAQTQARKVGRIDIHFSRKEDGSYNKQISQQLIDMHDYAPDSAFVAEFQPFVNKVNDFVDAPVGRLEGGDLVGMDAMYGPSEFMDLIHDAQLWATGADVSLAAILSPYDVVKEGDITMRHLFTLYKYENLLFTVRMTAEDIRKFLEYGYSMQFSTMRSANDHLLAFREGTNRLKTATFNFTSAAGIRYEVDVTKPIGERVRLISRSDGTPIADVDEEFVVAINSYQYSGGGNFIPEGLGWDNETLLERTIDTTPIDVRRYVANYIREKKVITPALRGDWKIVPEGWVKAAGKRDIDFMNNNQR